MLTGSATRSVLLRGIVRGYRPGPPATALIEPIGVVGTLVEVPVSHSLGAAMVTAGSQALVVLFDEQNPRDGVLAGVW